MKILAFEEDTVKPQYFPWKSQENPYPGFGGKRKKDTLPQGVLFSLQKSFITVRKVRQEPTKVAYGSFKMNNSEKY